MQSVTPMYVGRFPKLAARFTKVIVRTSAGKRCSSKIERELGDWFLSAGLIRKKDGLKQGSTPADKTK